jgi:hypothetical protein
MTSSSNPPHDCDQPSTVDVTATTTATATSSATTSDDDACREAEEGLPPTVAEVTSLKTDGPAPN